MIHFTKKTSRYPVIQMDSAYLRNFSEALLNWEQNRQETRFAFGRFDGHAAEKPGFIKLPPR
jgi:hypothetical protein